MRVVMIAVLSELLFAVAVGGQPSVEPHGTVNFSTSCSPAAQTEFSRAVASLHSFGFEHAITGFEAAAKADPSCGIAYWGLAMAMLEKRWGEASRSATSTGPLGGPPPSEHVKLGATMVARAKSVGAKSQRELDYIAAIEIFYKDYDKVVYRTRAQNYERAMEALAARYPQDREAAIFYALALNITLDPNDKTYANQLKAGAILEKVFAEQPDHPGVAHYLIHSYEFPPIASKGLDAARRYTRIAPSMPHARHVPSHIFTKLGYWQESMDTNRASVAVAKDELRQAKLEAGSYHALHAMDYIVYAALQLAKDKEAKAILDEVRRIEKIDAEHFAAAFAFAAIPARYTLERRQWAEAAELTLYPQTLSWQKFPQAESILWFARGVGAARGGSAAGAKRDVARLEALRDSMIAAKNPYWAEQAEIHRLAVAGWIARAEGRGDEAVALMRQAADVEDGARKHPVTPGPIQPAREMLAELLLELGQPAKALAEFELSERAEPNRFHGLAGAARAADQIGDGARARRYYSTLRELTKSADSERPELEQAKMHLAQ
jgi:tetratricopeptide (TPR) repeat protein